MIFKHLIYKVNFVIKWVFGYFFAEKICDTIKMALEGANILTKVLTTKTSSTSFPDYLTDNIILF